MSLISHMNTPSGSEFGLIDWIRRHAPQANTPGGHVVTGIGDDCAALRFTPEREVVVTTDMLMEGRHFRGLDGDLLALVGYKALGVNLSDIAAMAAIPRSATVAVALPRRRGEFGSAEIGRRIHQGLTTMAERFDVALVGGDTNAWDGPLVVSVTLLGEATERGLVRRAGARAGDAIFVTGRLGGSNSEPNQRHLSPFPRIREALTLHAAFDLHAMIDISDGLAADLGHILEESGGLGAVIEADRIPIHEDAREMSRADGRSPLEHALHDGEDFELCLTVAPEAADQLRGWDWRGSNEINEIGVITREPGLRMRFRDGRIEALEPRGFDHFRD